MVLYYETNYDYNHSFETASLAYLNRYPNPFAKHVKSVDTLDVQLKDGCLHIKRLILKTGRLPQFIKPFLGNALDSYIVENSIIDPKRKTIKSYTANIDHRKFIKVEEYLNYSSKAKFNTNVDYKVKFSSNFLGFAKRIEEWARNKFHKNITNTTQGLSFVMNQLNRRKLEKALST